ncbi:MULTISPECIES: NADPH:quinone reductase [unclassified Cryobacterium]|uniref:NADPH:quinone reductase n=1 Tax=unclassified Cryobacterium TaxID=2649013 RepID=UPI00106BBAF9|nr:MULTISPECIES: NADPH:quinone reductase [unclassified Cryobacterium]TFC50355.1 NADPH:quinone reductase [Cryobacterium sp. TMB3-1-2]TFC71910.1 NADPH:quinone reductase [Cryobacterium sp. TMB3-15]TFC78503.1 NADPH:quinone reductase [Cryobacterium sp. TMB3-10]TFD44560.1 NADPH:quinone reductase [Cryobacterium sp. TMB3-12]
MKAIVYSQTGDPSVLQLVDRPVTEPGAGEVRVRMVVSGVNPTDWKSRRGSAAGEKLAFDDVVPGQDGAGIVDAVGAGVQHVAVGDRVWLALAAYQRANSGSAQEYAVLPAERVFGLPANASFDQGASLGVPAITAHRALTVAEDGPRRLQPGALAGEVVLVAGGAGAVGHAAIQLARWAGASVITTVSSPEKAALATAAGAQHVLTYTDPDIVAQIRAIAPEGVDLIVEVAPAQNARLDLAVIRNRGSIAVYANNGGDQMTLDVRQHFSLNVRYQFVLLYTVGMDAIRAAAEDITAALVDGALAVGEEAGLPLHRTDLAHTADAHALVESDVVGKVLIDVAAGQ